MYLEDVDMALCERRKWVTHARKMTFQARSSGVRDDRHSVLPCNIDDLHDILRRVRIYYDAVRAPYTKETEKYQPTNECLRQPHSVYTAPGMWVLGETP
jgi:hypothetical protein